MWPNRWTVFYREQLFSNQGDPSGAGQLSSFESAKLLIVSEGERRVAVSESRCLLAILNITWSERFGQVHVFAVRDCRSIRPMFICCDRFDAHRRDILYEEVITERS